MHMIRISEGCDKREERAFVTARNQCSILNSDFEVNLTFLARLKKRNLL